MASSPLKVQRDRFLGFAFAAADLLLELDQTGVATYAAGAAKRFFGRQDREIVGLHANDLFGPAGEMMLDVALHVLGDGDRLDPVPIPVVDVDGTERTALLGACRLPGKNGVTYLTLSAMTATRDGSLENGAGALTLLSQEDFMRRATEAAHKCRQAGQTPELTMIELGGIAELEERLGKDRAEGLLRGVGGVLRARSIGDAVGRLSGEKYGFMHDAALDVDAITREIGRIAREADPASRGLDLGRASVTVDNSVSDSDMARAIAVTIRKMAEQPAGELGISSASGALAEMVDDTLARVIEFRRSLTGGNTRHVFQPIVYLADRRLHHSELLVRFEDGKSPQDIIAFAEDMQIISELDFEICRAAVTLLVTNPEAAPIAVNVSAHSIECPKFIDAVAELLRRERPGERLIFEVTESAQFLNLAAANAAIRHLRQFGHRVCLDDFGAGAAGFSYLQALDVDFVKFDGRYIRQILDDDRSRMMLKAMAGLCRELGIETVGEMIETEAQASLLRDLGIGFGQGFLFGRPAAEPPTSRRGQHSPTNLQRVSIAARRREAREVWS